MGDFDDEDAITMDMDKEGGEETTEQKVEEQLALQQGFDNRKVWLVKVRSFACIRLLRCEMRS